MKNNKFESIHYMPEEILQILIDLYNFQAYFCLETEQGQRLNFQTSIGEWQKVCKLDSPVKLSGYFQNFFSIDSNSDDLTNLLNTKENTLNDFCSYIARKAMKKNDIPIISSEMLCQESIIFKILKNEFEKTGIDTKDFEPDTKFAPFFFKHATEAIVIISRLAPGTLFYYDIKNSMIGKWGILLLIVSIIVLIAVIIFHKVLWYLFPIFGIPILLLVMSNRMEKQKSDISGYHTVKDLIIGMKKRMRSNNL